MTLRRTAPLAALLSALALLLAAVTGPAANATSVLMIWTNPHQITSLTQANHYLVGTGLGFRRKMGSFGHQLATSTECGGTGVWVERYDSRGFASSRTSCGDDAGQVWAKVSGVWKVVTHWDRGQDVMCWALKKYAVPDQVLDSQPAQCQTGTGALVAYHHA